MHITYWIVVLNLFSIGLCEKKKAECDVKPNMGGDTLTDDVHGTVTFNQESASGDVEVIVSLTGFNTTDAHTLHGFHVHEFGNITDGCSGAGGHYNPDNHTHGAQTANRNSRHAGDLGNIEEESNGEVSTTIMDTYISLQGDYNVIAKAVVIHLKKDTLDESIDQSGGAGARIACCVVMEVDSAHTSYISMTTLLCGLLLALRGYVRQL